MSTKRYIPTSYTAADALLGQRDSLIVANNTRLERLTQGIALRLHRTNVVTWYVDGRVFLRTGGWNTTTTRDRINRALRGTPWRVGTEKGAIHLYRHTPDLDVPWYRYLWPHHGTVTLRPDGTTDATPRPRRTHRPHTNPNCACAACVAKRDGWRGIARMRGLPIYEYEPAHPRGLGPNMILKCRRAAGKAKG